jgi:hypothetical protein
MAQRLYERETLHPRLHRLLSGALLFGRLDADVQVIHGNGLFG